MVIRILFIGKPDGGLNIRNNSNFGNVVIKGICYFRSISDQYVITCNKTVVGIVWIELFKDIATFLLTFQEKFYINIHQCLCQIHGSNNLCLSSEKQSSTKFS